MPFLQFLGCFLRGPVLSLGGDSSQGGGFHELLTVFVICFPSTLAGSQHRAPPPPGTSESSTWLSCGVCPCSGLCPVSLVFLLASCLLPQSFLCGILPCLHPLLLFPGSSVLRSGASCASFHSSHSAAATEPPAVTDADARSLISVLRTKPGEVSRLVQRQALTGPHLREGFLFCFGFFAFLYSQSRGEYLFVH